MNCQDCPGSSGAPHAWPTSNVQEAAVPHITDMLTFVGNGIALAGVIGKTGYDFIFNDKTRDGELQNATTVDQAIAAKKTYQYRANIATIVAFLFVGVGSILSMIALVHS